MDPKEKQIIGDDTIIINIPSVETWGVTALKYACKKNKVKGYTKMSKDQLIEAVKEIIKGKN